MDPQWIQSIVEEVLQQLKDQAPRLTPYQVPIGVSARHVHLSEHDVRTLFGDGYEVIKKKELSQPNQFAAEETVIIAGPRGAIEKVRVLGPPRGKTQVEVSRTDAFKLGLNPPVRQSGDIEGSSPVTIIGPKGTIHVKEGLIIAQAHIHMTPDDAHRFGVQNGEFVKVCSNTDRPITFEHVLVRVSPSYRLEMHIDTDEANAGFIQTGQTGIIIREKDQLIPNENTVNIHDEPKWHQPNALYEGKLLTHMDILNISSAVIQINKSTIVTPLAKDTAREAGKTIEIIE